MRPAKPPPKEPFVPSRQMREALSWRLVAEFHRRHPVASTIIETHPGGGQYDCLSLYCPSAVAHLNRDGSFVSFSDSRIEFDNLWSLCLTDGGLRRVADEMSQLCGLLVPSKPPSTGRETLAYRVMAVVMASVSLDLTAWEWRNGQEDTSSDGDQSRRDEWFSLFSGAREAAKVRLTGDPYDQPKYRFWFLLKDGRPLLCVDKNALCWTPRNQVRDLMAHYLKNRCVHSVAGWLLTQIHADNPSTGG